MSSVFTASATGSRAAAEINRLKGQVRAYAGKSFDRAELEFHLAGLDLDLSTNDYVPAVQYSSATNWAVRLSPVNRRAYVNPGSLLKRLFFFRCSKMVFPDLVFRASSDKVEEEHPE